MTTAQEINSTNFISSIKPVIEEISKVFNYTDSGLNDEGGVGYTLRTAQDVVYVWYRETNDTQSEVLAEEFNLSEVNNYELLFQVELNDSEIIDSFDNLEQALAFIEESQDV